MKPSKSILSRKFT